MPLVVGHSQAKYLSDYLDTAEFTVCSFFTAQFIHEKALDELYPCFSDIVLLVGANDVGAHTTSDIVDDIADLCSLIHGFAPRCAEMSPAHRKQTLTSPLFVKDHNITEDNVHNTLTIHEAARHGRNDIVAVHIKTGVPVDHHNERGLTPLLVAALANKVHTVEVLIKAGADVNAASTQFGTALHVACSQGCLPMVNTLLCGGGESSSRGRANQTCVFAASLAGELEVLAVLLKDLRHIDDTDINGLTPLHAAVSLGHTETALYLIERGASVRKTDSRGNLALHYAVKERDVVVAEALIKSGSNVDHMNTSSESPLHIAIRVGHLPTIWLLAEAGCDVNISKPDGSSILHLLVSKYDSSNINNFKLVLETLLLRGCNINTLAYNTLETPLYRAIGLQKLDFAEILIAYGADPNLSSPFDITALQLACSNESLTLVRMMLVCGVDWRRERWLNLMPTSSRGNQSSSESPDQSSQDLLSVIVDWRSRMPSVQDQCRMCIRKHYGDTLLQNLDRMMDIPQSVKNYLMLSDVSKKSLMQLGGSKLAMDVRKWFAEADEVVMEAREARFSLQPKNSDLMEELHD